MKKNRMAWLTAAVMSLLLLLGACGVLPTRPSTATQPGPIQGSVLWAAEDAPLCSALAPLAARYNELEPEHPVSIRVFPSEAEMLDALSGEKPDLLLCSDRGLALLREEGALRSLAFSTESAPRFFPAFSAAIAETGTSFYPLGAGVPVLVLKEDNRSQLYGCDTLERLCAAAAKYAYARDTAFFSAESFARLFTALMAQKNSVFHANKDLDGMHETYREIYNLLAGAAFDGGLKPRTDSLLHEIRSGKLVCGICELRSLAGEDLEGLTVQAIPPLAGCEDRMPAELWGLAVVSGSEDLTASARFVSWLCTYDHSTAAALEAGLLPAEEGNWADDRGAYSEGLYKLAGKLSLLLLPADSDCLLYGADFDEQFCAALALLQ